VFPTQQDIEAFQVEFGAESVLDRHQIPQRKFCGTQAAALIVPSQSKEETLKHAWSLVRSLARWVFDRADGLPTTERYIIIVGWSRSVRGLQGQIFKVGGDRDELRVISEAPDWSIREHALLPRWEKDVFHSRVAEQSGGAEPPPRIVVSEPPW
jgi:hypothetical protein